MFEIRARDIQTGGRSGVINKNKQTNRDLETFIGLQKIETARTFCEKIETTGA